MDFQKWWRSVVDNYPLPVLIALVIFLFPFCTGNEQSKNGSDLAKTYCASCHMFPEPKLLTKEIWKKEVLPLMGLYLGIKSADQSTGWDRPLDSIPNAPKDALLSTNDWNSIVKYYTDNAPDSFASNSTEIIEDLSGFEIIAVNPKQFYEPAVSFCKIDTLSNKRNLLIADLNEQMLGKYTQSLAKSDSIAFKDGAIVNLTIESNELFLCNVGILSPNNGRSGKSQRVLYNQRGSFVLDTVSLLKDLARPVQIIQTDLDKDGKKDYLVSEFGHQTGGLSWRKEMKPNQFSSQILRAFPGVSNVIVKDVNADGLEDVWALFSQGDEGIFLFMNEGNGKFKEQQILRFPPSYGSSSFELVDINKDGKEDIIYTCGDNSDFSRILKPYHGLYIYLNKGNNLFENRYFFPVNGCYKSVSSDFDQDGDMDIASISFFADYINKPEEGFVYLRNDGDFKFSAHSFPASQKGRWLTMDAGDLDNDGMMDIVIGNLSIGPYNLKGKADWKSGPQFIFLKNIFSRKSVN